MLSLVVFALFRFTTAIVDTNCTNGTAFLPSAFNCDNNQDDTVCSALYAPAANLTSTERANNCFRADTSATVVNPVFKDAAVASCPKACGYCCNTPEFSCTNPTPSPLVCSSIVNAQCKDPKWKVQIAQFCPNVCGFCLEGGCVDAVSYCASQQSICFTSDQSLLAFANTNCMRTCNRCNTTSTTTPSSGTTSCADTNANCAKWVSNGFCSSSFYTAAQKSSYCGRSCGLCTTGRK